MLTTIGIVLLIVVANIVRLNTTVQELQVKMRYGGCDTLIRQTTIERSIDTAMPTLLSLKAKEVDTRRIKELVMHSPYVSNCQAYVSILGKVVVKVDQRRPLLHVYHGGRQFYVDDDGHYMPLSADGKAHVMVVNGYLSDHDTLLSVTTNFALWPADTLLSANSMAQVWRVAHFLDDNDYYQLFDQIYADRNGDMLLTPRAGAYVVNIGDAEELDDKFERLMALYEQAMPRVGWDHYKQVSLKYAGQVVCKKR